MTNTIKQLAPLNGNSAQFRLLATLFCTLALTISAKAEVTAVDSSTELFQHGVSLERSTSGSLSVVATLGQIDAEFLLDTGASLVTVNRDLFEELRRAGTTEKVRQVGARLASGKLKLMDVYRVEQFSLGNCDLGPVEIAVMDRGGRNLLGMNALQASAPFAIYTSPPALALTNCS